MMTKNAEYYKAMTDKLACGRTLSKKEWVSLIEGRKTEGISEYVFKLAREAREPWYGRKIFLRGLIEFTNYCRNDCYYCGIRRGNRNARRYRLTKDEILDCCREGWKLGFRTFVLQGGEDPFFTDERMVEIISSIKAEFPESAITLSIGEKEHESYQKFFDAGADRYLLRHETACEEHYRQLHPAELSCEHRKNCLRDLKKIGYQVGCGFMVGAPFQKAENLADDMIFIKELDPAMVGIGPFIPHHDTPFAGEPAGTLEDTLFFLGLLRIMLPKVNLPATTALGTIHPKGRELGMEAGANVIMPNLSPSEHRGDYLLYDNKISGGSEAAEYKHELELRMNAIGYEVADSRGDSLNMGIAPE